MWPHDSERIPFHYNLHTIPRLPHHTHHKSSDPYPHNRYIRSTQTLRMPNISRVDHNPYSCPHLHMRHISPSLHLYTSRKHHFFRFLHNLHTGAFPHLCIQDTQLRLRAPHPLHNHAHSSLHKIFRRISSYTFFLKNCTFLSQKHLFTAKIIVNKRAYNTLDYFRVFALYFSSSEQSSSSSVV